VSTVRSVARTAAKPVGDVPAMLLLKRSGCPTVSVGSTAGSSWIKVFGSISANGTRTQPGSIHSDANGSSCGNSVFYGKAADGIVAYAAPKIGAPTTPDPTKPGLISSVAATLGVSSVDSTTNVYGASVLSGASTHGAVIPRPLVSRSIVDSRYLSGVKNAINGAQSSVFGALTSSTYSSLGYQRVTCSGGGVVSTLPALTSGDKLFVDCGNTKSIPTVNAGTVAFAGAVSPSADISLPNATHVYIFGATPGLDIGNGTSFRMNNNTTTLDSVTGNCKDGQSTQRAVLFVKSGDVKQTGGLLRLCNTTVYMMGGQNDGCVPSYNPATPDDIGPAPTQSPCTSGQGNGQISTTGGAIDWTAPNQYDEILDGNGNPDPTAAASWTSVDGPEDLALWDESAGTDSNPSYKFTGGGSFHIQGIFMVPNADSIALAGTANFVLKNAQFVATSLSLASNNTTLSMTVDPNSGIALQKLTPVGLVR
jgi:hypothetical protein